jgi:kynurenine formamidase
MSVDELSWQSLICPAVVIDVADRAHSHYLVSPQDIEQFEAAFGIIPPGALVLIRTGWERFWTNPDKYRNNWFFPSLAEEAALLLLERQIHGLGIDTLSPDRPDIGFKVHRALLSQGKYLIENVANSAQLPPIGSFILSLPLAIEGATESPIRLLAFLPKGSP